MWIETVPARLGRGLVSLGVEFSSLDQFEKKAVDEIRRMGGDCVTEEGERQQQAEWPLTTRDLEERFGVPPHLVYRWAKYLQGQGMVKKVHRYGSRGIWLIAESAVPFLRSRVGKVGRPPRKATP